jgi:DNA-binding beta-propeller fold protein YncE
MLEHALRRISLFIILLLTMGLILSGCDCAEGDTTGAFGPKCDDDLVDGGSGDGDGTGELLVSDLANLSIRRFEGISTLDSMTVTAPPLTGGLTQLTRPKYLSIHPTTGELIVADQGTSAILFFEDPSDLEGNVPPRRILTGVATELLGPVQTFVDSETDELYVLDTGTSQMLVFNDASTIDGAVSPNRRLGGGNTLIAQPRAFMFRASSEQVSVINPSEILTFESFKTINGGPPPSGRFGGPATTFTNLTYGLITGAGDLIVVDSGLDQILSFDAFVFDQLNEAPTRVVGGSNTEITEPRQFELIGDTMYLANGTNVLVFEEISTTEGNPFPDRKFSGLNPATQTLQGITLP